ncbi:hypothetical protein DXU03_30895 [Rhizobium johnstonii]
MAAEVEKLMEIVPPAEAKAFLKARCNLPAVELSTYVGFARATACRHAYAAPSGQAAQPRTLPSDMLAVE